jgi:membrane protease YdiL (CAAX protease family)
MEPEVQPHLTANESASRVPAPEAGQGGRPEPRGIEWVFFGEDGFRVGWRIAAFALLLKMLFQIVGFIFGTLHLTGGSGEVSAWDALVSEVAAFVTVVVAVAVMAKVEERRILDYNLRGSHRLAHFGGGMVAGFLALSTLVGVLAWGHWLTFGAASLSGAEIVRYGAVWGCVFLLVGCVEEGTMRCYAQYTLTRGISFWWALAVVAGICLYLVVRPRGNGAWGVFVFALVGLVPCLMLHLKKAESAAFWQAAWATSTFFGFGHTANNGENWIGIFAAALIGFVFCASVKVTGSAWWAIGCHAAWDWGETFFYGTPDSGFTAQGHYLTSTAAGATLWSGGADGPEGSVLVVPVVLFLLAAVTLLYGRGKPAAVNAGAAATQAG